MNKNVDITKILKNCPKGWEFYSDICGKVTFDHIDNVDSINSTIIVVFNNYISIGFTKEGYCCTDDMGEKCMLFPSKDQRDWSKFTAPWLKKERFDPKILKPFDRVIVRNINNNIWHIQHFSHIEEKHTQYPFVCLCDSYAYCIPYNDETKHLVGTRDEAPEYYKYWED